MTDTGRISRRAFIAGGAGLVAAASWAGDRRWALGAPLRTPNSRPYPNRPEGTPDPAMPIDHVVVVMMENHSFDNYLGWLPQRGQPLADGFRFDGAGKVLDTNPTKGGVVRAFRMPSECQMESEPNQSWSPTHKAIAGGAMTGFVDASGDVAMGYWDDRDLPFYYSLAKTFALANRWFSSAPCQTYPNRRYLMAGTSFGLVRTVVPGPNDAPPPNGTIFDRLNAHGISWTNYFTDLPQVAIIPSVPLNNPTHLASIAQFYVDAAAGALPAVSFVDPDFGLADVIGGLVPGQPIPSNIRAQGEDEENPQNILFGQAFVARVVNAVINSPAWPRTLLVWLYDEHGGYYDHVPPPTAIAPDNIPPTLAPGDVPGGFDLYGVRVPAVVVSPWARPASVSSVVHDHTSVLAFIERKWNLPAMTYRDANAASLDDFLDLSRPRLLEPPALVAAPDPLTAIPGCSTSDPNAPVEPLAGAPTSTTVPGTGVGASGRARGEIPATGGGGDGRLGFAALAGAGAVAALRRRAAVRTDDSSV
jgi:phospholipase C